MRNQLLTVGMQLKDAGPGDGGFCVVPGSHKSNYPIPPDLADLADPDLAAFVQQPELYPGDVLLFTEAVLHGTLPWTASHQRRTVIYRFAPAGTAYGRGYHPDWPASALAGMTGAQRAVLQAPYHPRMNRPYVNAADGSLVAAAHREAFKTEFDERVFGAKYF
jgi:ectoine hydroxylase-related dioxygenase (phytanoyl-CoA dioxygenase family)